MELLAIKNKSENILTCLQIQSPELKVTTCQLGNNVTVTFDELKMSIMARSCIMPGFSTLISNLLVTYSVLDFPSVTLNDWQREYRI